RLGQGSLQLGQPAAEPVGLLDRRLRVVLSPFPLGFESLLAPRQFLLQLRQPHPELVHFLRPGLCARLALLPFGLEYLLQPLGLAQGLIPALAQKRGLLASLLGLLGQAAVIAVHLVPVGGMLLLLCLGPGVFFLQLPLGFLSPALLVFALPSQVI